MSFGALIGLLAVVNVLVVRLGVRLGAATSSLDSSGLSSVVGLGSDTTGATTGLGSDVASSATGLDALGSGALDSNALGLLLTTCSLNFSGLLGSSLGGSQVASGGKHRPKNIKLVYGPFQFVFYCL